MVMSMTKVFKIEIQLSDYNVTLIWKVSLHRILSYENMFLIITYLSSKIYCGILYMRSTMTSLSKKMLFRVDEALF